MISSHANTTKRQQQSPSARIVGPEEKYADIKDVPSLLFCHEREAERGGARRSGEERGGRKRENREEWLENEFTIVK